MGIPGGGAKGLKTDDDATIVSPPPPGPQGTLLEGAGSPGIKVFPRVDPQLLESAEEMNVGPRDEVFLVSLDFHIARMSSFIHMMSASVALRSSRESKRRDSLCMLYAMSHSMLRVKGLSLVYSYTVGQLGCRARSMRPWDMSWASASTTHISQFESWLLIQCIRALLEAHSLTRAHMKSCITKSFR